MTFEQEIHEKAKALVKELDKLYDLYGEWLLVQDLYATSSFLQSVVEKVQV